MGRLAEPIRPLSVPRRLCSSLESRRCAYELVARNRRPLVRVRTTPGNDGIRPRPGIGETLNIRLIEVNDGRVVFEATPDIHVYNPLGTVHGGFAATMLDFALVMPCYRRCCQVKVFLRWKSRSLTTSR